MPRDSKIKFINRIIDANFNRAKEGLRVCEEISRFILNSHALTSEFKKARHNIDAIFSSFPNKIILFRVRDSVNDVGRNIHIKELERKDYRDIFFANIQRIKESMRVLEEFGKLVNKNIALKFKKLRYQVYEIEKKAARKLSALRYHR